MKILAIALTTFGVLAIPNAAESSKSRQACIEADFNCEARCPSGNHPKKEICLSQCTINLDVCFRFADTLEPPAKKSTKGKGTKNPRAR